MTKESIVICYKGEFILKIFFFISHDIILFPLPHRIIEVLQLNHQPRTLVRTNKKKTDKSDCAKLNIEL